MVFHAGEAFDGVNTSHSIFRFLGRLHYTIIRITLKNYLRALANFARHVCPRKPYLRRALRVQLSALKRIIDTKH